MRLLNISVTATGNLEQIYNSVSGVERARCSFSVDFIQSTKEYAALHPQDGEYIADHDSAASKSLQICRLDISQKLKLNHKSRNKGVRA